MRRALAVAALALALGFALGGPSDRQSTDYARAEVARALAGPLRWELVDRDGAVVARAAADGAIEVDGLTGRVSEGRLTVDGATVELPVGPPRSVLAERPARWDGEILVLVGEPPATATFGRDGRLDRVEIALSDGFLLTGVA